MSSKKQSGGNPETDQPPADHPVEIDEATPKAASDTVTVTFPIVGIGASAGGLEAFEAFFSAMPADIVPGMAFVLVQHLAPDHKSMLTELIQRYTQMQVFEVTDGMPVRPNCAYIIPPNRDMTIRQGQLYLTELTTPRGHHLPIDAFFRSLAQDQHEWAICIVLSGTGSDGALGVRAIKDEGGLAIAQTPESTKYDGMPRSAIATGLVDYILPPDAMPAQLLAYWDHILDPDAHRRAPTPSPALGMSDDALKKIFTLLRAQTKHDFSQYKQNTIVRRVERRMLVQQIDQVDAYVRYLQQTPAEVEVLFRELLIGVTSFFRDAAAFTMLETQAIPHLLANKPADAVVRVWVPGCSTGEEAYSLAILIAEYIETRKQPVKVQIFATDIDSQAIEIARAGIYPASIAADIAPDRLARFFSQTPDGHYRIKKSIRDLLVISEQDVILSPPFSRLDLISCRNLLIYLDSTLQKKLILLFHYALNPGGLLWLGSSETVGEFVTLFATVDRHWKLYQRQDDLRDARRPALAEFLPILREQGAPLALPGQRPSGKPRQEGKLSVRSLTERLLLDEYAPASLLVNALGDIFYIHGRTGRYLEPAPGEAGLNVLAMARPGLHRTLSTALHKAVVNQTPVFYPNVRVKTNGEFELVNLIVRPVAVQAGHEDEPRLYLVTFAEAPTADPTQPTPTTSNDQDVGEERILTLEQELRDKEEYLQATREEMETANEELQATNEELQSTNEELQSTNEELETAKEEMQSINEELATINAELQQKVADLSQVNNDMSNLLAGTGVGTVFVDMQLHIQRFTPAATRLINLIPTDIGRPVGHIVSNLVGYDRLVADLHAVLDTLAPKEVEVQTHTGIWYLLGIRPYRTVENVIEGVVITFVDITAIKKAEALRHLATIVHDAYDAIILQDLQGRILAWNPAAARLYGWSETEALTMNIQALIPEQRRAEELSILHALSRAEVIAPYQTERLAKADHRLVVWLTATALVNEAGAVYAIVTTERESGLGNQGATSDQ